MPATHFSTPPTPIGTASYDQSAGPCSRPARFSAGTWHGAAAARSSTSAASRRICRCRGCSPIRPRRPACLNLTRNIAHEFGTARRPRQCRFAPASSRRAKPQAAGPRADRQHHAPHADEAFRRARRTDRRAAAAFEGRQFRHRYGRGGFTLDLRCRRSVNGGSREPCGYKRAAASGHLEACHANTIVIFGASGDLTSRKLIPALFSLLRKDRLPPGTRIVGFARTKFSNDEWRKKLTETTQKFAGEELGRRRLAGILQVDLTTIPGDIGQAADFTALAKLLQRHRNKGRYGNAALLSFHRAAIVRTGDRPTWRRRSGRRSRTAAPRRHRKAVRHRSGHAPST